MMNRSTFRSGASKEGPHQGQPVAQSGAPLDRAKAAMIMVHGRGASADNILSLSGAFGAADVAYLAPQASGSTWYPYSFLAPIQQNEPGLSSGLQAVGDLCARLEEAGIPAEKTVLLGFSQGACLTLEYAARHPRRYGGVIALSGGLIGTGEISGAAPPADKRFEYAGSLEKTPVFLGCSDVDSHIPVERVRRSTEVLRDLGGEVTERIYAGMGHTIIEDEVAFVGDLLATLLTAG